MVVLDEQGEIIAAGLGQREFGRVAHGDADGAGAARGLRQRQDEADLDRAGADLVGRRGGRRRDGLLRLERRPADVRTGRRRSRSPPAPGPAPAGRALGQSEADGARQSSHEGGPQDLLAPSVPDLAPRARSSAFPSVIARRIGALGQLQACYHESRGEFQSQNRSAGNRKLQNAFGMGPTRLAEARLLFYKQNKWLFL